MTHHNPKGGHMSPLLHFPSPLPPYTTTEVDGVARVQRTYLVPNPTVSRRDAEDLAMEHSGLVAKLAELADSVRDEVNRWNDRPTRSAGDDLAEFAGDLVDLLQKVGY